MRVFGIILAILMIAVLLSAFFYIGYVFFYVPIRDHERRQALRLPLVVDCTLEECLATVTQYLLREGLTISYRDSSSATFTRGTQPDSCTGCVLLLLGIIPGLLYLLLYRGTLTTTVVVVPEGGGTKVVLSGDDLAARDAIRDLIERNYTRLDVSGSGE